MTIFVAKDTIPQGSYKYTMRGIEQEKYLKFDIVDEKGKVRQIVFVLTDYHIRRLKDLLEKVK